MQPGKGILSIIIALLCISLTVFHEPYGNAVTTNNLSFDTSESGPYINWHPDTVCMDGRYTGQTQETFTWSVWVNDSLGVDSVIFRFRWSDEIEWLNRTAVLVEGDEILGKYRGNLTWAAPKQGAFELKIFANNTLGYWNETSPMLFTFGYLFWNTSPTSLTDPTTSPSQPSDSSLSLFLVFSTASLLALIGIWKFRQMGKKS